MAGVSFVEILADNGRIADRKFAIDQHRDPAQRTEPSKLIIAIEGRNRVDLIVEPLEVHAGEHLAHVRADEAADDRDHGDWSVGFVLVTQAEECDWTRCNCSATYVA